MVDKSSSPKIKKSTSNGHNRVLYRKYRPTKLEDVVGQEQITKVLMGSLKQGKIAHAYLFIGPRGTGKTSVARIFAHAINNFDYQIEDSYLDIIEIDAASNTGVDNIREIREKAIIAPTRGRYKVYIIDEVHMLTKSASNALLKTLEEPPEHVIFIMATTDAHKIPITISSRAQVHTFRLANPDTMFQHLRKIANLEQIPITDDALKVVVRRGGGSFRDSLSLLDQITNLIDSDTNISEITAEVLNAALGLPQEQIINQLLTAYETQNATQIHDLLQNLLNSSTKPEVIASECIARILEKPHPSLLALLAALPSVQPPFPEAKLLIAFLNPSQKAYQTPSPNLATSNPTIDNPRTSEPPSSPTRDISPSKPPKISPESPKNTADSQEKTIPKPAPATKPVPKASKSAQDVPNFDWNSFVASVRKISTGIANQLQHTDYDFDGKTLHLFPNNKIIQKIFDKPENSKILADHLNGYGLSVHTPGDRLTTEEDDTISQISAIMGGIQEVKKDEMPF